MSQQQRSAAAGLVDGVGCCADIGVQVGGWVNPARKSGTATGCPAADSASAVGRQLSGPSIGLCNSTASSVTFASSPPWRH